MGGGSLFKANESRAAGKLFLINDIFECFCMSRMYMKKTTLTLLLGLLCGLWAKAQPADSVLIRSFFNEALGQGRAYDDLHYLCKNIGHRISGSKQAQQAVEFTFERMKAYGFDTVYLQEVMVPQWVRGEKEKAFVSANGKKLMDLHVVALGNSVGTGAAGLQAKVIEVFSLKELETLDRAEIEGKIVFYNRPFNDTHIISFDAYRDAVDQRSSGASEASKYGAVAVIVRSMTHSLDQYPHTGALRYAEGTKPIPAMAVSTMDAQKLHELLLANRELKLSMTDYCVMKEDVKSYNVVGEIKGSLHPEQIITVGGHLDSWDIGEGAHDDGAGCMQSMEALRLFKALHVKPERTIRAVMFMNEENGLRGGKVYAEQAVLKGEKHYAAIESDRGGFTPRGFTVEAEGDTIEKMQRWIKLLAPYGLDKIEQGGGGADISYLNNQGAVLIGYVPDSQRYFDVHHAATDVFESVNKRELAMGAASMASLLWLLSHYGF